MENIIEYLYSSIRPQNESEIIILDIFDEQKYTVASILPDAAFAVKDPLIGVTTTGQLPAILVKLKEYLSSGIRPFIETEISLGLDILYPFGVL